MDTLYSAMHFALSPDHQHKLRQKRLNDSGKSNNLVPSERHQTLREAWTKFESQGENYGVGWGG